ncbi:MAG TPA: type II secretion system protein [Chthoniobacter sp.]|jgi:type II secretory pathway pseudopilin PulG
MPRLSQRSAAAFTLLELMTVITVMLILAAMFMGVWSSMRNRAELAACSTNMKSLYTAAAAYVQQNGQWPQVATNTLTTPNDTLYPNAWINALAPFGIAQKNWLCPSVQREMGNPDMTKSENVRVDYLATPFDNKPGTPFLWPHQPWFIERGSVHPGGNLIIWSNGQLVTMQEALQFVGQAQ